MAVAKSTGETVVTSTAVEVIAANADRVSAYLEVKEGEVWFGPDDTVTIATGFSRKKGQSIRDELTKDDWYGITRAGTHALVSWFETEDSA